MYIYTLNYAATRCPNAELQILMSHGAQKLQSWDSKYVDDQFLAYTLNA